MDSDKNSIVSSAASTDYKVYPKRWVILFIYFIFAVMSAFQWYQYSAITNIIARYFNVKNVAVDWTTMIFNVTFIPLIFPASHFLNRVGMRWPIVLATFATAAGAFIKVASVRQDLFWVTFLGQTLVSLSQVVALPMPPYLAAIWFSSHQVNTACSLGINGTMLGMALGILVPPMMVKNHHNLEEVGVDLEVMFYWTAGLSTITFILAVFFCDAEPPTPSSHEQALKKENNCCENYNLLKVLKNLLCNPCYVLLLVVYAINQGVVNTLSAMLNQLILPHFKHQEEFAGRIGLTLIVAGMVGTCIFGIIMDRTLKYKDYAISIFALTVAGMVAFTFSLKPHSELFVYLSTAFVGFFLGAYVPVAYSFSYEVTYPEHEGTTGGMLSVCAMTASTLFTLGHGALIRSVGDVWANNAFSFLLVVGTILHLFMKPNFKRQAAHDSAFMKEQVP